MDAGEQVRPRGCRRLEEREGTPVRAKTFEQAG
jgi:hypothetical protein